MIEAGGPFSPDLVPHIGLVGLAHKGVVFIAVDLQFRFQPGEVPVVPGKFGNGQAGRVVAEQGVEFVPFDLGVQLLCARRIVALLGPVAVEQIVPVRIDGLVYAGPPIRGLFGAVIGHGEQPLALDLPLGIEGHASVVIIMLGLARSFQRFHVA